MELMQYCKLELKPDGLTTNSAARKLVSKCMSAVKAPHRKIWQAHVIGNVSEGPDESSRKRRKKGKAAEEEVNREEDLEDEVAFIRREDEDDRNRLHCDSRPTTHASLETYIVTFRDELTATRRLLDDSRKYAADLKDSLAV